MRGIIVTDQPPRVAFTSDEAEPLGDYDREDIVLQYMNEMEMAENTQHPDDTADDGAVEEPAEQPPAVTAAEERNRIVGEMVDEEDGHQDGGNEEEGGEVEEGAHRLDLNDHRQSRLAIEEIFRTFREHVATLDVDADPFEAIQELMKTSWVKQYDDFILDLDKVESNMGIDFMAVLERGESIDEAVKAYQHLSSSSSSSSSSFSFSMSGRKVRGFFTQVASTVWDFRYFALGFGVGAVAIAAYRWLQHRHH